ncbi:MAG: hypothetical protein HY738_17050 [Bacteroidia bacterium]|nr:hypothetical protein [Bacteroidia bacterium]
MKVNRTGILILFTIVVSGIIISSCKEKNDENADVTQPLNFISLIAIKDTVINPDTTTIIANATGDGLIYSWAASKGNIILNFSTNAKVTYAPSPCTTGNIEISCSVADRAGTQQSKIITIYVL